MTKILTFCIFTYLTLMINAQQNSVYFETTPAQHLTLQLNTTDSENDRDLTEIQLQSNPQRKSVGLALLYSLILPGLGEAYVGETGYTKIFLTTEALGWGLLVANSLNAEWRTKDYKTYSVQHAGVPAGSKDDQYWINIGKYDSIYEYNEQRRRDRNVDAIYEENAENFWRWDSRSNRLNYDWRRIRAREIEQQEIYFVGAIVLNHIVSAINALRLAKAYNKQEELSWRLNLNMNAESGRVAVAIQKTF